ncbi:MAG: transcriptional regulator [Pseudomonadota bacterium]
MSLIRIDTWSFAPDTGMLDNGEETRRLENRTAALLELLARQPGQVVSQSTILDHVWEGRTVSPNSIAVVISDLRRALNDDPKAPRILETLPKRGYRLIADVSLPDSMETPATDAQPRERNLFRPWFIITAIAGAILLIGLFSGRFASPTALDRTSISVSATVNETGDDQYLPLSRSVTELLSVELGKFDHLKLSADTDPDIVIRSKLILWDGHPSMSIYAESAETGEVLWSGIASGPETLLPRQVREEMTEFAQTAQPSPTSD